MNLLEMRKEKEKKRAEVRALLAENKIVEAETKMQEVRDLEAKIKIQEEIENAEARELNENGEKRNLDNGKENKLHRWHWVAIVGIAYDDLSDKLEATIADEGMLKKINLGLWLTTAKNEGGFVYFE